MYSDTPTLIFITIGVKEMPRFAGNVGIALTLYYDMD